MPKPARLPRLQTRRGARALGRNRDKPRWAGGQDSSLFASIHRITGVSIPSARLVHPAFRPSWRWRKSWKPAKRMPISSGLPRSATALETASRYLIRSRGPAPLRFPPSQLTGIPAAATLDVPRLPPNRLAHPQPRIAALMPCSNSTTVSWGQSILRSSSRDTTSPGWFSSIARMRNGCSCSFSLTPCLRNSAVATSSSKEPKRTVRSSGLFPV